MSQTSSTAGSSRLNPRRRHLDFTPSQRLQKNRFWLRALKYRKDTKKTSVLNFNSRFNAHPFSNHAQLPFTWKGRPTPTSLNVYLQAKVEALGLGGLAPRLRELAHDPRAQEQFLTSQLLPPTLENQATKPLADQWNRRKIDVMAGILEQQFNENLEARQLLLRSHPRFLALASPNDSFWGIGMAADDPLALLGPEVDHYGHNHLGIILMKIRERLRHADEVNIFLSLFLCL
jgi:ribA/ribD-fused uncharacterized protein